MGVFQNNLMGAAAAAASAGGGDFYDYQIANSCRFGVVNSYLTRAISGVTDNTQNTISFWVKRSRITGSAANGRQPVMGNSGGAGQLEFVDADTFRYASYGTLESNVQLFRDTSAWYHIHIYRSTSDGGGAIYVNGVQVSLTTNTAGSAGIFQNGESLQIGASNNGSVVFDGYIAEVYGIYDQNIAHTEFGEFKNGVWIPKDASSAITFGSHDFYLKFESSGDLGNDSSGNNNDFSVTNVSAHDQMLDSPTFNSSSNGGNFATIGPLWKTSDMTFSEGNLKWTCATNERGLMSNWAVPIGTKAYWEYIPVTFGGNTSNGDESWIGINQGIAALVGGDRGGKTTGYAYGTSNGYKTILDSASSYGATIRADDVVGVAVDRVNHTINFSKNNSWQGTFAISSTMDLFPFIGSGGGTSSATGTFNFGQDGTFAGTKTAGGNADENGYGNFLYAPPSGFLAMCSGNLPIAEEVDPAQTDDNFPQELFSPTLYTGTNADINVPVGFQPDWVWLKNRGTTYNNYLFDSTRGVTKILVSDGSNAESTTAESLKAFISTGFTYGDDATGNEGSASMVSWNWRANGGTTSSDASGDITSVGQVDPSGCFSIFTYTGNGTAGATVAHHLDQAPDLMIFRERGNGNNWITLAGTSYMNTRYLVLDTTAVANTGLYGGGRTFSSSAGASLFTLEGATEMNRSSGTYVGYGFSNCEGYIKIGEYEGNGNADGSFVYTGFRPAWIMTKALDSTSDWQIFDNKREGYNVDNDELQANTTAAESTTDMIDIVSNGFKCRIATDPNVAETYLYIAFAHNPFKYATAR